MLDAAGVAYRAVPAHLDERALEAGLTGSPPAAVALALAEAKALAVSAEHPGALVLGSWVDFVPRDWDAQLCMVQIGGHPATRWKGTHTLQAEHLPMPGRRARTARRQPVSRSPPATRLHRRPLPRRT